MLSGAHASARVAMIRGVAEILYLGVSKLSLGINEQDFAGDLVVLLHTRSCSQQMAYWAKAELPGMPRSLMASSVDLTTEAIRHLPRSVVNAG